MDKRRSPNYKQVSGYIPVEQYKRFKLAQALFDVEQSTVFEEAFDLWIKKKEEETGMQVPKTWLFFNLL